MYASLPKFHDFPLLDIIENPHAGEAGSEMALPTIRYDSQLRYSPCVTGLPRSLSHYANYKYCLVTRGDSRSLQLVIPCCIIACNEAKNRLLHYPLSPKLQDSSLGILASTTTKGDVSLQSRSCFAGWRSCQVRKHLPGHSCRVLRIGLVQLPCRDSR